MFTQHGKRREGRDHFREGYDMAERSGRRGRFGGFRGGFAGGPGFDGPAFHTGRKLGSQDLQLLVLALLSEGPSHGYELIKTLEERSGGFYSPSPGMIYPALTYLEELGHASVEVEGAKKLYRLTDDGKADLEAHRADADAILAQLAQIGQRMGDVRRAFSGDDEASDSSELRQARRELRQALHDLRRASPDEQRRVAEILRRAAAAIAAKGV